MRRAAPRTDTGSARTTTALYPRVSIACVIILSDSTDPTVLHGAPTPVRTSPTGPRPIEGCSTRRGMCQHHRTAYYCLALPQRCVSPTPSPKTRPLLLGEPTKSPGRVHPTTPARILLESPHLAKRAHVQKYFPRQQHSTHSDLQSMEVHHQQRPPGSSSESPNTAVAATFLRPGGIQYIIPVQTPQPDHTKPREPPPYGRDPRTQNRTQNRYARTMTTEGTDFLL